MESNEHSVTLWLDELRQGDDAAAEKLWHRFFSRMKHVAESRLHPGVAAATGGEDLALSAYNVFVQSLREGKFPDLANRDELWRLLVTITIRKSNREIERASAHKRGSGKGTLPLDEELNADPKPNSNPATIAMVNDECEYLMKLLDDPELELVALWKLEGMTNDEIAAKLGSTKRTVQRMTALIRNLWKDEYEQIRSA